jgi:hypothetical protein
MAAQTYYTAASHLSTSMDSEMVATETNVDDASFLADSPSAIPASTYCTDDHNQDFKPKAQNNIPELFQASEQSETSKPDTALDTEGTTSTRTQHIFGYINLPLEMSKYAEVCEAD